MKKFQFSKIKTLRESAGLSLTELSKKINISPQQLWNWENAEDGKSLTVANLAKIAAALGRKIDDFFVDTKKPLTSTTSPSSARERVSGK